MKIKVTEEDAYQTWRDKNTQDSYSAGVVDFAERWASLMEAEIAQGKTVGEVAEPTSRLADTEGITGFMYGCAKGALCHFWLYAEDLAKWKDSFF